jgi:transposase
MGMRLPVFVRTLTNEEHHALHAGLRSPDAFVLRRCQILLASARGDRVPQIARNLACDDQSALTIIHAFNQRGLATLTPGSRRPHHIHPAFDPPAAEKLRHLLHQSPRAFGKPTSLWTLALAAEVSFETGLTPQPVSPETIRATLRRLGLSWRRAKAWITSPDPQYAPKKTGATD